jgi:hypothetical protein
MRMKLARDRKDPRRRPLRRRRGLSGAEEGGEIRYDRHDPRFEMASREDRAEVMGGERTPDVRSSAGG